MAVSRATGCFCASRRTRTNEAGDCFLTSLDLEASGAWARTGGPDAQQRTPTATHKILDGYAIPSNPHKGDMFFSGARDPCCACLVIRAARQPILSDFMPGC